LKVRPGIPSLRSVRLVRELERSFAGACERGDCRLVHYSLQGDHAHLLVEVRDRHALGRGMKSVCARLARAVNRVFGRRGRVLADRYHLQVLRTPRQVRNALRYVLLNHRKHARRPSLRGCVDPASSGRWFDGWKRGGSPTGPRTPLPVARAHTWLLSVGWRKHGLISVEEIPGAR
jgi:REP element-mobilizing transposase RayT